MAEEKISELPVTAIALNAGSFMIISQELGGQTYESQKLPIEVLTDLLEVANLSNTEIELTGNRSIDGSRSNFNLTIENVTELTLEALETITLSSSTGDEIVLAEGLEITSPTSIQISSTGNTVVGSAGSAFITSTNGDVNITTSSSSKNIVLSTNANGALVLPSGADPRTNILAPLNGMAVYSVAEGSNIFYENGVWDDKKPISSRVKVNTTNWAAIMGGTIDSTKEYYIDGIVDPAGVSIDLAGGLNLNLSGGGRGVSKIISNADNYTMITGADTGEILTSDITLTIGGSNSQLMNVVADTGFEGISFTNVNFDYCTSLGEAKGFNQGLEIVTRRFGGTPELTLSGTWSGGYFIETSLVRLITDGSYSLFKAGASFTMASRFRSNQNIDLNTNVSFFDFSPGNFLNSSSVQLAGCIISRNSSFDTGDANITPNMLASDLVSDWSKNKGIKDTFVGGEMSITVEAVTSITTSGVFVDLAGTFTADDLQHFDSPVNGQLRYKGSSQVDVNIIADCVIDSTSANEVDLKVIKWDDSAQVFVDGKTVRRVINNLQGGRDTANFYLSDNIELDEDDYIAFQVANVSATNNITCELSSNFIIKTR